MRQSTFAKLAFLLVMLFMFQVNPASAETKPALHKAEFRVTGASCVVCLRRIGKTFREQKGVLKADVSVFRPYWSIIIYDAHQTDFKKIESSISNEHVTLEEIEDKPIAEMPVMIIPKHISTPAVPVSAH